MNLDLASLLDFRPSLIGSLSTIAGTAVGAPIDCKGFQSCLGIVAAGGVQGSTGATVTLSVKVQESADPAAVGTAWSDITNEAMSAGSFSFSGITFGPLLQRPYTDPNSKDTWNINVLSEEHEDVVICQPPSHANYKEGHCC